MLNYNKIHSDINKSNIFISDLARFLENKYTSFKDRLNKEKLYAWEIEKIANYFGKPISYYFDQDETEGVLYNTEERIYSAEEPHENHTLDIDPKQKKIEELTNELSLTKERMVKLNKKYTRLLEKKLDNASKR